MKKQLVIFISVLSLFGCGQQYQTPRFDAHAFEQNKAVIILGIAPAGTVMRFAKFAEVDGTTDGQVDDDGYWKTAYRVTDHRLTTTFLGLHPGLLEPALQVMMVDPGYYTIQGFYYEIGDYRYSSGKNAYDVAITHEGFGPRWGAFYAEPGSVTYIGDIEINYTGRNTHPFRFTHNYNIERMEKKIKKKYPALYDQVKRGSFYSGGNIHPFNK